MDKLDSGNWSSLPPQSLHLICTKFPDIADLVRLRAVCKSWRSSIDPSEKFHHLPYLLINDRGPSAISSFEGFHYINKRTREKYTLIISDATSEVASMVSTPEGCPIDYTKDYLVESDGEILRIVETDDYHLTGIPFYIYQIAYDEIGTYHWVETKSIGDRMLFLEMLTGFSLRSSNFPGIRENCIYFLNYRPGHGLLCRYDLEHSTVEILPYPHAMWGTWILPRLC